LNSKKDVKVVFQLDPLCFLYQMRLANKKILVKEDKKAKFDDYSRNILPWPRNVDECTVTADKIEKVYLNNHMKH